MQYGEMQKSVVGTAAFVSTIIVWSNITSTSYSAILSRDIVIFLHFDIIWRMEEVC